MPMTHLYTIMCDDVRQENNGKFILIGMYSGGMTVPMIPISPPVLTFYVAVEIDRPGDYPFRMKLIHLETGKSIVDGSGQMQAQRPGRGQLIIPFRNLEFQAMGSYTFSIQMSDSNEPLVVYQFDVILRIPQRPQQQPRPGY
jgi:hypothetical protein